MIYARLFKGVYAKIMVYVMQMETVSNHLPLGLLQDNGHLVVDHVQVPLEYRLDQSLVRILAGHLQMLVQKLKNQRLHSHVHVHVQPMHGLPEVGVHAIVLVKDCKPE